MEPLLRLAHKYELKVPLHACTTFLANGFNSCTYTSLPRAQLDRMPHWLCTAGQLGLDHLHAAVMACLQDNLLAAVETTAHMCSDMQYERPGHSSPLGMFQSMWAGGASGEEAAAAQLDAVLAQLSGADKEGLLRALLLPACCNTGLTFNCSVHTPKAIQEKRGQVSDVLYDDDDEDPGFYLFD